MDIAQTSADDREIIAALLMRILLDLFGDEPDTTMLVTQLFRGNERILSSNTIPMFLEALAMLGIDDTCDISAIFGWHRHIDMPIIPNARLDLNSISQSDCKKWYRFDQDELRKIIPLLPFPEYIIHPEGDKVHIIEAFCIVIRRMSSRATMRNFQKEFGRSEGSLCRIMMYMTHLILERAGSSIFFYPITWSQLNRYLEAFRRRGIPDSLMIVACLDNKKQQTCKPTHNQKSQYNRFKKGHGPKHQTLHAPDGLILHEYAGDGRSGDGRIARESGLPAFWTANPMLCNYRILTDSAYANNNVFVPVFKRNPGQLELPIRKRIFNRTVTPARTVGGEDDYSLIVANWALVDNKKSMKMELSPVIAFWALAVWLTNLLTCTHGANQVSEWFDCLPPSLEEFIHATMYN